MHRSDVLIKYGRYVIGTVEGQKPRVILPTPGTLSPVPYAEPSWLSEGYYSPYYKDSHRSLQKFMRKFVDEEVKDDANMHELDGKRPTVELIQKMGKLHINAMVGARVSLRSRRSLLTSRLARSAWARPSSCTA